MEDIKTYIQTHFESVDKVITRVDALVPVINDLIQAAEELVKDVEIIRGTRTVALPPKRASAAYVNTDDDVPMMARTYSTGVGGHV